MAYEGGRGEDEGDTGGLNEDVVPIRNHAVPESPRGVKVDTGVVGVDDARVEEFEEYHDSREEAHNARNGAWSPAFGGGGDGVGLGRHEGGHGTPWQRGENVLYRSILILRRGG
jgi:hypothetical protein